MPAKPTHTQVADMINRIEAEMKRIGMWQSEPLHPNAYQFRRPFAMDTMAYSQWLQFIFVPRVREIIEQRGQFPPDSHVGAQAVREFDGMDEANNLLSLLCEFDALIGRNTFFGGVPTRAFPAVLPFNLRMKGLALALGMGAWMLMAFLIAFAIGNWLNMQLPRMMMWDAMSDKTPEGLEVIFQFQTHLGSGRPGPVTIDRWDIQLSLDVPPEPVHTRIDAKGTPIRNSAQESIERIQQNMRIPVMDRRSLVAEAPKDGEILISAVTRDMVRGWFTEMIAKTKGASDTTKKAVLARADEMYDAIENARSAKTSADLLALPWDTRQSGLPFNSIKHPLEYANYLKDLPIMAAGFFIGLVGLIPFYGPLMKVRRQAIAWRQQGTPSDAPEYR